VKNERQTDRDGKGHQRSAQVTTHPDDINLDKLTMMRVFVWPSGEWSASGWDRVWHGSGRQPDIETALRKLVEDRDQYFAERAKEIEDDQTHR
jgi:hypothetical protein